MKTVEPDPGPTASLVRAPRRPGPSSDRPPGPRGNLALERLVQGRFDPLQLMMRTARRYGDVAFLRAGPFPVYLLSHPDHVRDILVTSNRSFMKGQGLQEAKRLLGDGLLTSEGDVHRRQRRLIQPLFHHTRIAGYGATMVEHGARAQDRWSDGQELDVHRAMMQLTLGIVGATLFDADIERADALQVRDALTSAFELFDRFTLPFAAVLFRLPLPGTRRFNQAKGALDGIIDGMIGEHRASGDRGDLLSMLIAATDEEGDGGGMTDRQVRDEAMTILLAGHETTANALTWTWYLLSQHPEVEGRLHAELDEILTSRLPTHEDVQRLVYAERVVAESMRLYPPAWILGRRALQDHSVGGYTMPAGSIAVMCQYVVHHDPRWYPDPFRFDPDRFTPEAQAGRPRYAYFPFGGGPRLCIGESFAWMEAILLVATLAQRWRFRLVPGHPVALLPQVTLRPRHGMRMRVHRRH